MGRWTKRAVVGATAIAAMAFVYVASTPNHRSNDPQDENSREALRKRPAVLTIAGPQPDPPVCRTAHLALPKLATPLAPEVQKLDWAKIQIGPCRYSEGRPFTLRNGRFGHRWCGINSQTGRWKADRRMFTPVTVHTTMISCLDPEYGDMTNVTAWGTGSDGRLYLLNREGSIEIVLERRDADRIATDDSLRAFRSVITQL